MSYSNDLATIRAGLVNYIGAMLSASEYEDDYIKKHKTVAILSEEMSKICKDNYNDYEMYVCKPVLRLVSNIAKNRFKILDELGNANNIIDKKNIYKNIFENIDKIVESINK